MAEGFKCIVSCIEAGFFLVPAAKAVSNGMLVFISRLVRKLNSNWESCSLHKTFLNNVPESNADICVSNKVFPPLVHAFYSVCILQEFCETSLL